ncbi:PAS domain-containing sensor histidine kinase [Noviherbaspirillum suwonense]|uniref:Oxygen sensor histidine kinase NreB n=1 Tax=Noviherbaspirillum suwonense TaxID=1224511 RepID=A0ABY1QRL0_9BURK|nr:PAS domain-containing sensor histidine kinase [Noviherbaspirillum suwonense]SMP77175.1 PAS domain S-box-containing protein [Noviherbaspirillum suwonense]
MAEKVRQFVNARIRSDPHVAARLRKWSGICGKLVFAAGWIGLAGSGMDGVLLKHAASWGMHMTGGVALVAIFGSGALLLINHAKGWRFLWVIGEILALAVIVVGIVSLAQHSAGVDVGIEGILLPQGVGMAGRSPIHMTVSAALDTCMLGAALLLLNAQSRGVSISQLLVMPAAFLALASISMSLYVVGVHGDQAQPPLMPLDTAIVFLALCIGILFAHPDRGPLARLACRNAQGFVLRRLIPAQLVLVMAVSWLIATGHRVSLFSSELGTCLGVIGIAAPMAFVIWWSTKWLDGADAYRRDAEEALRDLNAQLESRVAKRTKQLEMAIGELKKEIQKQAAAKDALKRSEANYRFLFECNPLPLYVVDQITLRFIGVNEAALEQYGYTSDEFLGMTADRIRPEDEAELLAEHYKAPRLGRHHAGVWRHKKKDGTVFDVDIFYHGATIEGRPQSLTLALDVTERRRAEQAQRDYAARLRVLSYQLLNVQEAERARIAAELHDEVGQMMTALKLGLQSMRGAARSVGWEAKLADCIQLAAGLLDRIRNLSLDLRPPLLGEIGLAGALDAHVKNLAEMSGQNIEFDAGRLQRLSPQIEIACFRVAQEALTNAVRHAKATRISVRLFLEQGRLQLRVADNGVGFDREEAYRRALAGKSMGLLNMAERVKLIGGSCAIRSAPGQGTSVEASFPPDNAAGVPFIPAGPNRPAPS